MGSTRWAMIVVSAGASITKACVRICPRTGRSAGEKPHRCGQATPRTGSEPSSARGVRCRGEAGHGRRGLPSQCSDLRAQRGVRSEHPAIAVAVQARGRDQRGLTSNQLQGCEVERRAAIGLGFGQAIHDLIVADLLEALQREGRPSSIAQQPFSPGAIGAFDAD